MVLEIANYKNCYTKLENYKNDKNYKQYIFVIKYYLYTYISDNSSFGIPSSSLSVRFISSRCFCSL